MSHNRLMNLYIIMKFANKKPDKIQPHLYLPYNFPFLLKKTFFYFLFFLWPKFATNLNLFIREIVGGTIEG